MASAKPCLIKLTRNALVLLLGLCDFVLGA